MAYLGPDRPRIWTAKTWYVGTLGNPKVYAFTVDPQSGALIVEGGGGTWTFLHDDCFSVDVRGEVSEIDVSDFPARIFRNGAIQGKNWNGYVLGGRLAGGQYYYDAIEVTNKRHKVAVYFGSDRILMLEGQGGKQQASLVVGNGLQVTPLGEAEIK